MQCCSCSVFTVCAACHVISHVKYVLYFDISTSHSSVQCPIWLFFVVPRFFAIPVSCWGTVWVILKCFHFPPIIAGITFAFTLLLLLCNLSHSVIRLPWSVRPNTWFYIISETNKPKGSVSAIPKSTFGRDIQSDLCSSYCHFRHDCDWWRPHNINSEKETPVVTGATGTISKSLTQYLSNVLGWHEIKELQTTAILGANCGKC